MTTYMQRLDFLDFLFTLRGYTPVWKVEFDGTFRGGEELGFVSLPLFAKPLRQLAHDLFHHGEVLEIVVGLEQRYASVQLD